MGIVFAVRGDSYDARYSNGGKTGVKIGDTANITMNTDSNYLSGSNIQFAGSSAKVLTWPGRSNTPNGRAISILCRMSPTYTGSPASARVVLPGLYVGPDRQGRLEMWHSAAGNITAIAVNEAATTCVNSVNMGAWSPTSGTIYDHVMTWDGTTTANSFKHYIDATLLGQTTPTAAFTSSWTNQYFNVISFGNYSGSALAVCKIDEIVFWDSVIDPTSVALVGGTGSLNGASRTALVDVTALDGASWSALTADKIKTGESQTQAGATVNGTYTGSDRWTSPAAADLRSGTQLKSNSTTLNLTGTLDLPAEANVKEGVVYDNTTKTGTYTIGDSVWTDPRALTLAKFLGMKNLKY